MKKLVFATNNRHKLAEVQDILGSGIELISLEALACFEDIPETEDTLEGNALLKARYIFDKYHLPCFADDTGLEVDALDGAPGVYSARYAGEACSPQDNINKLLHELRNVPTPRRARFRTVIALVDDKEERLFEGEVLGQILTEPVGIGGFGYDPIFCPEGYTDSFSVLGEEVKNKISHRAKATEALAAYLKNTVR